MHSRAAPRRVGKHRVHIVWKGSQVGAGERLRLPFDTRVGSQRPAARLTFGDEHLDAVMCEHPERRPVDVGGQHLLRAPG